MRIAGVDGCPGGWVAVCADDDLSDPRIVVLPVFEQLPDALGGWPDAVAVDMPIGLVGDWDRTPEPEARRMLGRPRSSSVFPAPPRRLLEMFLAASATGQQAYVALNSWSKRATGKGLQQQTFHLLRRIGEIDSVLQSGDAPPGIFEVHPEMAFWAMNGNSPTQRSKHRVAGRQERRSILSHTCRQACSIHRAHAAAMKTTSSTPSPHFGQRAAWPQATQSASARAKRTQS